MRNFLIITVLTLASSSAYSNIFEFFDSEVQDAIAKLPNAHIEYCDEGDVCYEYTNESYLSATSGKYKQGDIIDGVGTIISKIPDNVTGRVTIKVKTPDGLIVEVSIHINVGNRPAISKPDSFE